MSVDTKAVINPTTGQIKSVFKVEREQLLCPVCGIEVDYLLGDDLGDGRQGCEACWRPPTSKVGPENAAMVPPPAPPATPSAAPNQLADFDREVKHEYGKTPPPLPGITSPRPASPDNDFQQFKQNLVEKAKAMDGGDTHG